MGRGMTECGGILAEYGNVLEWRRKSEAFVLEKMARGILCRRFYYYFDRLEGGVVQC